MKLTRHNGRFGKNGTYNPRHNDRRFDVENSEHIAAERVVQNIYWGCYRSVTTMQTRADGDTPDFSFEQIEHAYYLDYGLATMQPKFIFGALYLFAINALFIMLSAALVTKLMGIPSQMDDGLKWEKRVKRLITSITVPTVIPSVLIGGFKVYQTVMEQNFANFLDNEFAFSDTQVVKSSMDVFKREVSVSWELLCCCSYCKWYSFLV